VEFEDRVSAALRHAVPPDVAARSRIMARVREASRELPRNRTVFIDRGVRRTLVGLALAAGIGSVTTIPALLPRNDGSASAASGVIGDTVVSTLRDTLRLVRLMFDDPGARRVAVIGDFDGARDTERALTRDPATRRWSTTLALRDGSYRYAFVVDGTRWVPDARAERVRVDDGRVYSLLHVARATN
jgi:hypothetical protein